MNYKLLRTDDFTGKKIYEKIDDDGKSYLSCSEDNEEFKEFECIAKKVRPSAKEIELNNRSRSAIMRVFKKL